MTQRHDPAFAAPQNPAATEPSAETLSLEDIAAGELTEVPVPTNLASTSGMRSARLISVDGRQATITLRGGADPTVADVADEVETELLGLALKNGDSVLVELAPNARPLVVGMLQTRVPREVHVAADEVHLQAAKVLVLKAGRAALKLHEDGEVELLGTKINAVSRGLFKIVGRVLRLN
ncbi:MAG: hypothetical protein IPM54_16045 [Polyangiaceae bacterium]|nr:hypothetical protein [Polyangiaceae bacterium]